VRATKEAEEIAAAAAAADVPDFEHTVNIEEVSVP
jgi:hypothetical protein